MPYLKINHDDAKPIFESIDLPAEPRAFLHACYDVIGCESIQTVPTILRGILLVIDEEGKLKDGWYNRFNKVASNLYSLRCDIIVGDAILARVDGENLVPLTSKDIEIITSHF